MSESRTEYPCPQCGEVMDQIKQKYNFFQKVMFWLKLTHKRFSPIAALWNITKKIEGLNPSSKGGTVSVAIQLMILSRSSWTRIRVES